MLKRFGRRNKMETNYEIIGVTDIEEVALDIETGIGEVEINE